MKQGAWTTEEEDRLLALRKEGYTLQEAAELLDRTLRSVEKKHTKLKQGIRVANNPSRKISPLLTAMVLQYHISGFTAVQIASLAKLAVSTVRGITREAQGKQPHWKVAYQKSIEKERKRNGNHTH